MYTGIKGKILNSQVGIRKRNRFVWLDQQWNFGSLFSLGGGISGGLRKIFSGTLWISRDCAFIKMV